jgi:hypothetical protein
MTPLGRGSIFSFGGSLVHSVGFIKLRKILFTELSSSTNVYLALTHAGFLFKRNWALWCKCKSGYEMIPLFGTWCHVQICPTGLWCLNFALSFRMVGFIHPCGSKITETSFVRRWFFFVLCWVPPRFSARVQGIALKVCPSSIGLGGSNEHYHAPLVCLVE